MKEKKGLLVVGLACVDILSYVDRFPTEDEQQIVNAIRWALGGNAANSSVVLGQLGAPVSLFAALGQDAITWPIVQLTEQVDYSASLLREGDSFSLTTAIVNESTGSRTILHKRSDMNEPTFDEFKVLDLSQYSWVHFEARNLANVRPMMDHCLSFPNAPIVSVEVEKPYEGLTELIPGASYVFLSKEFSRFHGCNDAESAIRKVTTEWASKGATVICAWGEVGATALDGPTGQLVSVPAYPPPKVVDTLGAGDTFVAATLYALFKGFTLQESIDTGCRVAGAKVGQRGLLNIPLPHTPLINS